MVILAIESSCDECSAAVMTNGNLQSHIIVTQLIHEKYGGVVPELASRAHQQHIISVVTEALKKATIQKRELGAIAFTRGPGLLGSLLVGTCFAKSMALGLNIPLIEVNHLQAHVMAHFIEKPQPSFPFLCLTVSGGHTQIILVNSPSEMKVVGQTQDDAAGEAFDKMAKIMGFPYPGGVFIDKWAKEGNFVYPFPKINVPNFEYSFSGLKTSFLNFIQKETLKNPHFVEENRANICASIQEHIVNTLLEKVEKAAEKFKIKTIAIAGGVSANTGLRKSFETLGQKKGWKTFIPKFEYCTDNAAMIAMVAHFKALQNDFCSQTVTPSARMNF